MPEKGFSVFILTLGVFLILFAALGLVGSINTTGGGETLVMMLFVGLVLLLAMAILRKRPF